ncbi:MULTISPECIES: hypothetical protein [Streptomyces]|uniref:hypothetical protein n=1 Tax=Streptomyces TaxID=1883 RepID=UPI00031A9FDC|nr:MULTISPECIES: hypothetical protein [Streptomyces]MCC5036875.1 hypothetical protein [Streptomyces sp. WAC 00631]MCC9737990.1 hypothetical protein [Streptomyces sp. MNU89]MZE80536.1 hypothetical protein [Streptomyces sp. SID5475]
MRRSIRAALTLAAATVMVGSTALPASAEPNPPGCPKGYFCGWSNGEAYPVGTPSIRTAGNWSGSVSINKFFNNGYAYPGADHVTMTWYTWGGSGPHSICVHYNPGPGQYEGYFGDSVRLVKVRWRGEC